jgi:hypothetical protein
MTGVNINIKKHNIKISDHSSTARMIEMIIISPPIVECLFLQMAGFTTKCRAAAGFD